MEESINPIFPDDFNKKFVEEITELKKIAYCNHFHIVVRFDRQLKRDPIEVLVHHELNLIDVINYIRNKCQVSSSESIILFCKNYLAPPTASLQELYNKHGKEKKLKFDCMKENTFG